METAWAKLFLRISLAAGFLSAVADRFGLWSYDVYWGNWTSFIDYCQQLMFYFSQPMVTALAWMATIAEVVLALALILGYKLKWTGYLSGLLLLSFALAMTISGGVKTAFDASVFAASAGAFALAVMKKGHWELK